MKFGKFLKALGQLLDPDKRVPYPMGTFFLVLATKKGNAIPYILSYGWDFRQVFNYKMWPVEGYDDSVTIIVMTHNPRNTIMKEIPVQAQEEVDWAKIFHGLAVIPGGGISHKDVEGFILAGDGMSPHEKGTEI